MLLAHACSILSGYTARGRIEPVALGGVLAIQLRDLSANGRLDVSRLMRVQLDDVQDRHLVHPDDVLFRSRGDRNTAAVVGEDLTEAALAVLPLMILRPKANIVSGEYLTWAINHPQTQRFFDSVARGTKLRMVSRASLEQLDLDIPDLETQKKIIAIDALAERERVLSARIAGMRKELTSRILGEYAKQSQRAAATERTNSHKTRSTRRLGRPATPSAASSMPASTRTTSS